MPRIRLRAGLAALTVGLLAVGFAPAAHASDFPAPTGFLVDAADAVPETAQQSLEAELEAYAERSGHQLAVALVDGTGGESIENYANDLFGDWGVGSAERDDGVLIVVAIDDRQLRIEVGRGLEGTLTDIEAADIIRDDMVPRLKTGDYVGAVRDGERAVRAALGDPTPNAGGQTAEGFDGYGGGQPRAAASQSGHGATVVIVIIFFVLMVLLSSIGNRRRRSRSGGFFPIFIGSGWGGGGGWSGGGGGGFGGFGGGSSGGGGASGSW